VTQKGEDNEGRAINAQEAQTARQPNSPAAITKDGERGPEGQKEEQHSEREGQ
jgi:hypothetical protein